MNISDVRIDVEAAKALAEWNSLFAAEVFERAKRFAAEAGDPDSITLLHYRMAAKIALQSLSDALDAELAPNGQTEAA